METKKKKNKTLTRIVNILSYESDNHLTPKDIRVLCHLANVTKDCIPNMCIEFKAQQGSVDSTIKRVQKSNLIYITNDYRRCSSGNQIRNYALTIKGENEVIKMLGIESPSKNLINN